MTTAILPPDRFPIGTLSDEARNLARAHGCEMYVAESVGDALRIHGLIA